MTTTGAAESREERARRLQREASRRYRLAHPDTVAASHARYKESEKGKAAAARAQAKRRKRDLTEYNARPDVRARRRAWDARPENAERRRQYAQTEAHRASLRRTNVRRRGARGDLTSKQELALRTAAKRCALCSCHFTPAGRRRKELDHIVPINQGGTHTLANVRIVCSDCNKRRPHDGSDFTGQLALEQVS